MTPATAAQKRYRQRDGRCLEFVLRARRNPSQQQNGVRYQRAAIGAARERHDQRIKPTRGDRDETGEGDRAARHQQPKHERQRQNDIGADIAAAQMHVGKGRDDAIGRIEIPHPGEGEALVECGSGDQGEARPPSRPRTRWGAVSSIRQARRRNGSNASASKNPFATRAALAGSSSTMLEPPAGPGKARPRATPTQAASAASAITAPPTPPRREIPPLRRRAQRQHGDGDEHHEVRFF